MARKYEGSAADKREDKAGAARRGISQRDYEKTAADRRQDERGQAAMNAAGARPRLRGHLAQGAPGAASASAPAGFRKGGKVKGRKK